MRIALIAVVLAACAKAPDLPLRPDPSPPPGSTTEVITARDGTQLLARHWPAKGDTRGVLVIMHGLKDYSARYAALATRLAGAGYSIYAFDLRGHGRSAGPRVAPRDWNDYVDDLDRFLTLVEQREPGKKLFLFGHSMGGEIAARTAEVHRPALAGLILSGAALEVDASPLLLAGTRLGAALAPGAPGLSLDNKDFSSDPHNAAVMDKDELISQPPAPTRTAGGLIEGMHAFWASIDALTMPLLALHGTADRLTAPSGSRALVLRAPSTDKTLRIYDGYFHDLVHEPGDRGAHVADDIQAWLDAHTGGAPVPAPAVYAGHLAGDPRGWTQAVELGGGISQLGGSTHGAGRIAIELARPSPIGWHGALTARLLDGHYAIALRPIGVALHVGGTSFGIDGGGSLVTGTTLALSGGAWLEQSLGPVHLGGFAELDHRDASVYLVGGTLRLGGDRGYWPGARAGVGPMISAGAECASDCGWFAIVGLELFGAD